jgi:exonuclease III
MIDTLKGLFWNYRGIRKKGMSPYVRDMIKLQNLDFLCFQETMVQNFSDACFRKLDPNKNYLWDWSPRGKSGGLLSGFKVDRFDVGSRSQGDFILQHNLWDKKISKKWNIMNIYGAAQDENKDAFLTELASFCSKNREPYLAGGDFNILRFLANKNKNFHPNRFSGTFNVVIQVNDLRELDILGGYFTWSNNHSDSTLERLDKILMSREWEMLFPSVHGHKEPRNLSNHNPLIISIQLINSGKRRDFRFELYWLDHPEFLSRIKEIWTKPTRDVVSLDRILFKLKKVKKFLKGWGFNLSGTRKRRKKEVAKEMADLETLEEVNTLSHAQQRGKVELKSELLHILEEEELYWFKRSRENWLLKGDNNTEYFHRIANGNKRKQTIYFLKDGDNIVQGLRRF